MNFVNIIDKKSKGLILEKEEIDFFVKNYLENNIPDYQASAFLMTIKLKGLNDEEFINYSKALINSGKIIDTDDSLVDKHSSGGVGDKTTIVLLPILASMGLKIFKMSGKGLGFTGGTIDKLSSIEGFDTQLTLEGVKKMVNKIGLSITSQTPKLVPADGKIYSLRDITATVDSNELIAASIISKKIASGAKNILIDLKVGTGAFINDIKNAKELARLMKLVTDDFNKNLFVLISSMDQPLGFNVGNKNEIVEAINFLKGNWSEDFYELVKKISIELYSKSKGKTKLEAEKIFDDVISSGKALKKQKEWFKEQGVLDFEKSTKFLPKYKVEVLAKKDGYISFKDVKKIGNCLIDLKAGRKELNDTLDFNSGINFFIKNGDKIFRNDKLFDIYSSNKISQKIIDKISEEIIITNKKRKGKVILGELKW